MMLVKTRIINTSKRSFYIKSFNKMADFVRVRNLKRYKIKREPLNTDFKTLGRMNKIKAFAQSNG
jgi:hypothetical protein